MTTAKSRKFHTGLGRMAARDRCWGEVLGDMKDHYSDEDEIAVARRAYRAERERMKAELPIYSVVVSFNAHYDAHWIVRARSAGAARRVAIAATRRHKGIRKDIRWYAANYTGGKRYSMQHATARIWREKDVETEWDIKASRITTRPYLYCTGT